jgi:hypothetical protein
MKKSLAKLWLMVVFLGVIALTGTLQFGAAQRATSVNGAITSNTTWTKANSPYDLTGSVTINEGVTLTIEPGVIINLNLYSLQVNGTLNARGTANDPINFNGGFPIQAGVETMLKTDFGSELVFSPTSTRWNPQTQTGSLIEYAVINSVIVNGGAPKISHSSLLNIDIFGGGAEISNNIIIGGVGVYSGPTVVSNNTLSQQTHYFLGVIAQRYDRNNAVVLMGNNVSGTISDNILVGNISQVGVGIGFGTETSLRNGTVAVTNNTIGGFGGAGIAISDGSGSISICGNFIHTCRNGVAINEANEFESNITASVTVQRNIISNCTHAITTTHPATIENNTIEDNSVGLETGAPLTVTYNNIQNNTQSIYLLSQNNVTAINNWWGTTNIHAINQTIYDYKNDSALGGVTFVPYLALPNTQTTPAASQKPVPTLSPTPTQPPSSPQNPTATTHLASTQTPLESTSPSQSGGTSWVKSTELYEILIVVLVALIVAFVVVLAVLIQAKKAGNN